MAFSHHACQSGHRRYRPEYSWCGYSGLCISYPFWCTESAASGNTVCSREYSGIIIPSGDRRVFFFQHNILVYLSYVMVFVTWFILEKQAFGLKIRAGGRASTRSRFARVSVWQVSVMQRYSSAVFMPVQQVHLCLLLI